nr:uncharacterized protein LOC120360350 [Saimiri boliviensis boliviensis]
MRSHAFPSPAQPVSAFPLPPACGFAPCHRSCECRRPFQSSSSLLPNRPPCQWHCTPRTFSFHDGWFSPFEPPPRTQYGKQTVKAPDCSTLGLRKARSYVISASPFSVVPGDPAMPPAPLPTCFRGPTFQACPHQRPSADTQGCSKHHSTSAFSRKSRGCLGGPGRWEKGSLKF